MKRQLKEFNDSWDGMLPININKKQSIPKLDTTTLYSEEEMFRVYDIKAPKTIGVLGNSLMNTLIEYENPMSPFDVLTRVKLVLNNVGYDVDFSPNSLKVSKRRFGHGAPSHATMTRSSLIGWKFILMGLQFCEVGGQRFPVHQAGERCSLQF